MSTLTAWPPRRHIGTTWLAHWHTPGHHLGWALSHSLIYLPTFYSWKVSPVSTWIFHSCTTLPISDTHPLPTLRESCGSPTCLCMLVDSKGVPTVREAPYSETQCCYWIDCQLLHLGLFCSGYLLHQLTPADQITLKQVEFNTILSSIGCLPQQVTGIRRWVILLCSHHRCYSKPSP